MQGPPRVPSVAADEREGGDGQAGAVLCSQSEQEDDPFKSSGQGKRPRTQSRAAQAAVEGPLPSSSFPVGLWPRGCPQPTAGEEQRQKTYPCPGKPRDQAGTGGTRGASRVLQGQEQAGIAALPLVGPFHPVAPGT